jgi:thiazolylpeptide-type bacteriocin precursor
VDTVIEAEDLFASFGLEELEILEVTDAVALPPMGASSASVFGKFCCSSSSGTCCC